jgi:hypothetical protein
MEKTKLLSAEKQALLALRLSGASKKRCRCASPLQTYE